MARLRGPGGCPWDREQTIHSLRGFVLEETYEVLDAIDNDDHETLRGEIGDLLFEGVFLAQIESDEGRFTVTDSLRHVSEKLIRRHPHVFARTEGVDTPGKVVEQWEQIKRVNRPRPQEARAAERDPEVDARAPARPRDRHARRGGGLRLGQDDGCRREDRGGGRRAARGGHPR